MLKQIAICVGDRREAQYALDFGKFILEKEQKPSAVIMSLRKQREPPRAIWGFLWKKEERAYTSENNQIPVL